MNVYISFFDNVCAKFIELVITDKFSTSSISAKICTVVEESIINLSVFLIKDVASFAISFFQLDK